MNETDKLGSLRIGFIGAGRLGSALAWSLTEVNIKVAAVASSGEADAKRLATRVPECAVVTTQEVVDRTNLVFITTPDEAICPTVARLRWRPDIAAVHCSGVTEVAALASAAGAGAMIGGFHPMQTFGDPATAVRSLPGCTITIEADEPLLSTLKAITQRLECRVNQLPPGRRGRYHAAAGYLSQFINVLFAEAATIWKSWGATEEEAVRALLPLAKGTLSSIEAAGIANGMAGPVSRGDIGSIEKHVAALSKMPPDVIEFYRMACDRTVRLGTNCGSIDKDKAERLRRILSGI
ncbi:DUF2520 domain-containing protein [Bradyrhizobium yuanmingense]|uniref:Rossmann-like and DUF2520 domain-containing protein n=1 Tax=Bradyrhizobium yuanmingense TaxID=108015 RepID=UPI0012FB2055|nr:DUF2520 domain-containing protein [Bradyrhizobium yuanmingense]MVT55969.1 DUF2520 domain-containing protein [Bradyrhizobium yuanmingense]